MKNNQTFDPVEGGFAGIKRGSISHLSGKELTVLLHILVRCNHCDNDEFFFDGKLFPLKRGNWIASVQKISSLSGLTIKNVRTALSNLKKMEIIRAKNMANRATLISIENTDYYLVSNNYPANNVAKKLAKKRQTNDNLLAINNNENNEDNKNNGNNDSKKPTPKHQFHIKTPSQTLPQEGKEIPENLKDEIGNMKPIGNFLGFARQGFNEKHHHSLNTQSVRPDANSLVNNLSEFAKQKAKRNAPDWCLNRLAEIYITGISERGEPDKGYNAAFPGWCLSYTKGNPPG